MSNVSIETVADPAQLAQAGTLFAEYAASIDAIAGASLAQQGFGAELAALPGKYAPPRGTILLGVLDGAPVACAAIRPLDAVHPGVGQHIGEVKRMYTQPRARGRGLGRMLLNGLFTFARGAGYTVLKLDTSAAMTDAIRLYTAAGFVPCERYNDDPDPTTLWFECWLGDVG